MSKPDINCLLKGFGLTPLPDECGTIVRVGGYIMPHSFFPEPADTAPPEGGYAE